MQYCNKEDVKRMTADAIEIASNRGLPIRGSMPQGFFDYTLFRECVEEISGYRVPTTLLVELAYLCKRYHEDITQFLYSWAEFTQPFDGDALRCYFEGFYTEEDWGEPFEDSEVELNADEWAFLLEGMNPNHQESYKKRYC
jgi:hypothetical protein